MDLAQRVHTLGTQLLARHGERIHKVAINAGFTCPNRDGSKGRGGCTFCNNASFTPHARRAPQLAEQLDSGGRIAARVTGAGKFIAYFQAYTNTYADVAELRALYEAALAAPNVIGLSVGTRPDCVPDAVLDLLAGYRDRGHEVWLELGLQSAFDATLERLNRGHGFAEYADAVARTRRRGLPVCTHLILGLPGETHQHQRETLARVLEHGTDGLKLHPLHVVKATQLAYDWKHGGYDPLAADAYVEQCVDLIRHTPPEIVFHRVTGTAPADLLLAPQWCATKWPVVNAITQRLAAADQYQGSALGRPYQPSARESHVRACH